MSQKYLLVTGTSAAEAKRLTSMRGIDTHLGTLVERPAPVNIERMMEKVNDSLYPNRCKCRGVMHEFSCRAWLT